MIYAGIGARETPDHVLHFMKAFAFNMAKRGYTLRSGGAIGADTAFANSYSGFSPELLEVYLPLPSVVSLEAVAIAAGLHPNWTAVLKLGTSAVLKLGRNSHIILGKHLKSPVDFVACWTKGGGLVGGTAMAIRVAKTNGIPVFNMAIPADLKRLYEIMEHGYIKEAA